MLYTTNSAFLSRISSTVKATTSEWSRSLYLASLVTEKNQDYFLIQLPYKHCTWSLICSCGKSWQVSWVSTSQRSNHGGKTVSKAMQTSLRHACSTLQRQFCRFWRFLPSKTMHWEFIWRHWDSWRFLCFYTDVRVQKSAFSPIGSIVRHLIRVKQGEISIVNSTRLKLWRRQVCAAVRLVVIREKLDKVLLRKTKLSTHYSYGFLSIWKRWQWLL